MGSNFHILVFVPVDAQPYEVEAQLALGSNTYNMLSGLHVICVRAL